MTNSYSALLIQDQNQAAGKLWLIRASELTSWRESLEPGQRQWIELNRFKAKPGEFLLLSSLQGATVAAYGIGQSQRLTTWELSAAVGKLPPGSYRLFSAQNGVVQPGTAQLGWLLSHYQYNRYRSTAETMEPRYLLVSQTDTSAQSVAIADAVSLARDLITTPTNDMGPDTLETAIRNVGNSYNAEVTSIVGDDLLTQNYPTIHMVGRAANIAPRLVDLTWGNPAHPKLILVGKGVCFDTGGLDIKPAAGMLLMKKDMGGAAIALALAQLVMEARLPVRLRLLVPAVENSVAGNAFRPGDVVKTRSGMTVEIGNTDAEGRLILSDALSTADDEKPDLLIDFATLTGAARVALGPDIPALFTNDDHLADSLAASALATDDPLWRLPLWEPYADMLSSSIADMNNTSDSGFGGAITAALFLKKFVVKTKSWAHIDVNAWNQSAKPGRPKGGEAMALRAFWGMLRSRYTG